MPPVSGNHNMQELLVKLIEHAFWWKCNTKIKYRQLHINAL